jgi:hypothetical protein
MSFMARGAAAAGVSAVAWGASTGALADIEARRIQASRRLDMYFPRFYIPINSATVAHVLA